MQNGQAQKLELPRSTRGRDRWSVEEDAELLRLRDRGMAFLAIGRLLHRSEPACIKRFEILNTERAWRIERRKLNLNR